MKSVAVMAAAAALCVLSCGDSHTSAPSTPAGLEIRTRVLAAPSKLLAENATVAESLIVLARYSSDTVRRAIKLSGAIDTRTDTISGLPSGDVSVLVSTVGGGKVVHSSGAQQTTLEPGQFSALSFWLVPACGSIYISLSDIPNSVATVHACFTYAGTPLCTQAPRAARVNLAIDYVPDGSVGTLVVAALSAAGDTLYQSSSSVTYRTDRNVTYTLSFSAAPGGLVIQTLLTAPGVTLVASSIGNSAVPDSEYGPIIISEIMYNANFAEYVELHNPSAQPFTADSLALEVDGARRWLRDISIPAGDFFVVGRYDSVWADTFLVFLDLTSTTGNWLAVRDKTLRLVDWVAFAAGTNNLGWPSLGSVKSSIVLDSLSVNPRINNYGANWKAATSAIGESGLKGTPGVAGT